VTPKTADGRHKFVHSGRTIYEWEQSLEEVNVYIAPPPGVTAKHIACTITPKHLTLGIKGNPPFINEDLGGLAVADESYWMMEDGELHINIQKARKAETWPSALAGHAALDPVSKTEVQKKMMLERFQEENPGFDFSGADFNGNVPDPRTFMEGVKYK